MTVRSRIFRSSLALLLLPIALIALTAFVVRGYYAVTADSQTGVAERYHVTAVPRALVERAQGMIVNDPSRVTDPRFLESLTTGRPQRGVLVLREGVVVASAPADARINPRLIHGRVRGEELRMDFRFDDGSEGALVFLSRPSHAGPWSGGPFFLLTVIGLLLVGNGLISRHASRRIVGPLTRLRDWADRLEAGELDESLKPEGDREIRDVMASIEAMRIRLRESLLRQLHSERSRRELVAALSHDLRTPITAIKGYVEGLRDGIPTTAPDRERYLAVLHDKAALLERMIGDLFLFSRLDVGEVALRREPIDVARLIGEVVDEFGGRVRIEWSLSVDEPVSGDRDHLRRAIYNIVENSVKYSPVDTVVLSVSIGRVDGATRIAIADDGPGVAREDLERIFEALYRGDPARGQERSGSGLGLAVVRQVLSMHGGRAWAESKEPRGLRIVMEIP